MSGGDEWISTSKCANYPASLSRSFSEAKKGYQYNSHGFCCRDRVCPVSTTKPMVKNDDMKIRRTETGF